MTVNFELEDGNPYQFDHIRAYYEQIGEMFIAIAYETFSKD